MARASLLQMLEDLAGRVKSLERERNQTAATIQALERDIKQAAATIEAFERAEKQTAATIQELEREKKQASLTIQGLEREVGELGAVIAMASEKVSEMLKDGAAPGQPEPQAVNAAVEPRSLEQAGGSSIAPRGEPKDRSSKAWRFD